MDITGGILLAIFATLLIIVSAAIVLFLVAVWFGLHVVAPRIRRALDRTETEEDLPGDQPD